MIDAVGRDSEVRDVRFAGLVFTGGAGPWLEECVVVALVVLAVNRAIRGAAPHTRRAMSTIQCTAEAKATAQFEAEMYIYLLVLTFQFRAGEVVESKGGTRQSASVNDSAVAETTIRAKNHTPLNAQSENEYLQMRIANFAVWDNMGNHTCTQRTPDRRHVKFELKLNPAHVKSTASRLAWAN